MIKEYSTDAKKLECLYIMLKELGMKFSVEKTKLLSLFPFFFQVHIPKLETDKTFHATIEFEPSEILGVYKKYNLEQLQKFLMDPICKQLFRFVFKNFQETYLSNCRSKIRQLLKKTIESMLHTSKLYSC